MRYSGISGSSKSSSAAGPPARPAVGAVGIPIWESHTEPNVATRGADGRLEVRVGPAGAWPLGLLVRLVIAPDGGCDVREVDVGEVDVAVCDPRDAVSDDAIGASATTSATTTAAATAAARALIVCAITGVLGRPGKNELVGRGLFVVVSVGVQRSGRGL